MARDPDTLMRRAFAHRAAGRMADAIEACERVLAGQAGHADALHLLGLLRCQTGQVGDGVALLRRAVEAAPEVPQVWWNLATALSGGGDHAGAAHCHARMFDLGVKREWQNRLGEALEIYRMLLPGVEPARRAEFEFGISVATLRSGALAEGFRLYEARFAAGKVPPGRHAALPRWDGTALDGRAIVLEGEQGFGDTLQFVRYAPLVAARGGAVWLDVPAGLHRLLAGMPGVAGIVAPDAPMTAAAAWCPMMSLPAVFGTDLHTVPAEVPYLRAGSAPRLPAARMRVGLAFTGSADNPHHRKRELSDGALRRLLARPGVEFHLLQPAIPAEAEAAVAGAPSLVDHRGAITDFADTAAIMRQLDLVISVDTAVAHLAGALGVPVWIMLPFVPDWRWMLGREDSPWYPTARLFRQTTDEDWDGVVVRVAAALDARPSG